MSLKAQIQDQMKTAMKAKDQAALRALRALKAAILVIETSEGREAGPLTDKEEMQMLLKQAKQRRDSIEQYRKAGRDDLAVTEEEELEIINRFLPQQLTPEELEVEVRKLIDAVGATSMKDMGKVMGMATKQLAGRADGKAISALVKQILG